MKSKNTAYLKSREIGPIKEYKESMINEAVMEK